MQNEIVKIDPSQYGLDEKKSQEIVKNLTQVIAERDALGAMYDEVIKSDIELPETAKRASELRKQLKKNRTQGIEAWHKGQKEFWLRGGQFVDAIKNKEIAVNERMEANLEQIEKHQEIKEQERKAKLKADRSMLLAPYVSNVELFPLGEMEEEAFNQLLEGQKLAKKQADEAEKERIRLAEIEEAKKAVFEKRKAALVDYVFYLKEMGVMALLSIDTTDDAWIEIQNKAIECKKAYEKKQKELADAAAAEKKKADEADTARLAAEKKAKEISDAAEAERLKSEKLLKEAKQREDELKAKALAEELAQKKAAEALAKKPDIEKLALWVDSIAPGFVLDIKNPDILTTAKSLADKLEAYKTWAKSIIDNLK
jgi:hypothetical protein